MKQAIRMREVRRTAAMRPVAYVYRLTEPWDGYDWVLVGRYGDEKLIYIWPMEDDERTKTGRIVPASTFAKGLAALGYEEVIP